MSKVLKNKCSLEEEYRFEHLSRIKAEAYVEEIWRYACELQKEVARLQTIVSGRKAKVKTNGHLEASMKLKKIFADRKVAIKKWSYNEKET